MPLNGGWEDLCRGHSSGSNVYARRRTAETAGTVIMYSGISAINRRHYAEVQSMEMALGELKTFSIYRCSFSSGATLYSELRGTSVLLGLITLLGLATINPGVIQPWGYIY